MQSHKYLYLLRHAKSSWSDISLPDWARPLNDRGRRDAPLMASRLSQQKVLPELIVSSTAVRAFDTACTMAHALGRTNKSIVIRKEIYEASAHTLIELIQKTDSGIQSLMLVGHNPGLTNLTNALGNRALENLPTCAWVRLRFENANWSDIKTVKGHWDAWDKPKLARKELNR